MSSTPLSRRDAAVLKSLTHHLTARQHSRRTVKTYCGWARRFLAAFPHRSPQTLGVPEVNDYLAGLANARTLSPSSQNQAASALTFLLRIVLRRTVGPDDVIRAPTSRRMPVVLTRNEVHQVLDHLRKKDRLVVALLYGSGLRILEALTLRLKDVDFERREIHIRNAKGYRDRVTMIPRSLATQLAKHVGAVQSAFQSHRGSPTWVPVPRAIDRKIPNAGRELPWQWVFPSSRRQWDKESGRWHRHHRHQSSVQRAVRNAAKDAGLRKRVTCHTFRHSFATHLLQDGYDIRTIQELLGHSSVRTTMIYTHVLNRGGLGVRSPLDT